MRKRTSNGCRNSVALRYVIDRDRDARGGGQRSVGKHAAVSDREFQGGVREANDTHSREVRKGPVGGVAPGGPLGFEERIPVLAEVLLHLPQQLVVGHAAQSVHESRRVAKIIRHRWIGHATHFSISIPRRYTSAVAQDLRSPFGFSRALTCRATIIPYHLHTHAKVRALLTSAATDDCV